MRQLALFFVAVLLLPAAVLAYADKQPTDDEIYDHVRNRLASDRNVKGGGIEVQVADGVVTLRGRVHDEKQKNKAEQIAKKVKGVKKVVNELQAGLGGATPEPEQK